MSIEIRLYVEKKKVNSTKLPTGVGGQLILNCNIKAPSSVIHPTIEIATTANILKYNYAYIPQFSRYYWINDMTFDRGLWVLDLSVDVLATYQTDIGSTSMYILRSSAQHDGGIMDNLYAIKQKCSIVTIPGGFGLTPNFEDGTYVLGLQSYESTDTTGCIYFILTPTQLVNIVNNFYNNTGSSWWGNAAKGVINSLNRMTDFIVNLRWYPGNVTFSQTSATYPVKLGTFNTNVNAPKLKTDTAGVVPTITYDVPQHPQVARGTYLNYYPYSKYVLRDPLVGEITLDPNMMANLDDHKLYVSLIVDPTTGIGSYEVYTTPTELLTSLPLFRTNVKIGLDININGAEVDVIGAAGNIVRSVASFGMGDYVGFAAGVGSAAMDLLGYSVGQSGSAGGIIPYLINTGTQLSCYFMEQTDQDNANHGRPLCQMKTPASLGGYMEADNPHVQIIGTSQEADMVNSYLASGIYYE